MSYQEVSDNYTSEKEITFDQLKELDRQFDKQLQEIGKEPSTKHRVSKSPKDSSLTVSRVTFWVCTALISLLLPFFVLIRTSVYTYSKYDLNGWISLTGGALATFLLLLAYVVFLSFKFRKKFLINRYFVRSLIVLVIAYCCYGLLYLSSMNVKSQEIRTYYSDLHPILRITLATATIADGDMVITDIQRQPEDYRLMGLPPVEQSLHYVQDNGYVHAVDLRTIGQPEWRNWLMRNLFNILGFKTIRHVGTADHLHLSLPLND